MGAPKGPREWRECPICKKKFQVWKGSKQVYCSPEHGYEGLRRKREQHERQRLGTYGASASAYDLRNTGLSWREIAVQIYGDSENRRVCAVQSNAKQSAGRNGWAWPPPGAVDARTKEGRPGRPTPPA